MFLRSIGIVLLKVPQILLNILIATNIPVVIFNVMKSKIPLNAEMSRCPNQIK